MTHNFSLLDIKNFNQAFIIGNRRFEIICYSEANRSQVPEVKLVKHLSFFNFSSVEHFNSDVQLFNSLKGVSTFEIC